MQQELYYKQRLQTTSVAKGRLKDEEVDTVIEAMRTWENAEGLWNQLDSCYGSELPSTEQMASQSVPVKSGESHWRMLPIVPGHPGLRQ